MKPLLVGESNPYGADPRYALYPAPHGCAGERLCRLVLGLSRREYLTRFDRVNLCAGKWSLPVARKKALELGQEYDVIVLLGARVAHAFEIKNGPFFVSTPFKIDGVLSPQRRVTLPHPSGLCRAWNESGAYERARACLREAGVL